MADRNTTLVSATPQYIEKFWSRVLRLGQNECWPWQGTTMPVDGYGRFWIGHVEIGAHRAAFYFHTGINPAGTHVCHTCDNPPCCNPNHLFQGTNLDNIADKVRKGRQSKGAEHAAKIRNLACGERNGCYVHPETVRRGELNGLAKLSDAIVRYVRRVHAEGVSCKKLARHYNVNPSTIERIVRRKSWRHVQ